MNGIKCEHPLTCKQFVEEFNEVSLAHHARIFTAGGEVVGVTIITDYDDSFMAFLGSKADIWSFDKSAFYGQELNLMAQLAATMPELRGGKSND